MAEYKEVPDRELLHHITQEEQGALEALYTRYATSVFSLAMFMLRQPPLAEEVTQDVFLNIWRKAATYKTDRGEPKAWIMSIAHHRIVDVIRSRRRTPPISEPGEFDALERLPSAGVSIEEEVEGNFDRDRIIKALASLPEAQRQVIIFSYFEGYSQSEMAKKLRQPLGTVKTRVRLAMQKLRTNLEDYGREQSE